MDTGGMYPFITIIITGDNAGNMARNSPGALNAKGSNEMLCFRIKMYTS